MLATLENVQRIIRAATGEEYPDGDLIEEWGVGYAERSNGSPDQVWVLGNWNPKRYPRGDEPPLTPAENLGPRLFDALERLGVECEWLDEWDPCSECYKLIRTQPDCYSWTPQYAWLEDAELVCADCLISVYGADALADFINDPRKAVTFCDESQVEEWGFLKWEPGDERDYANGWFPGQTDDPEAILASIHARYDDAEVVFFITEASQFYIRFAAYFRSETYSALDADDCDEED